MPDVGWLLYLVAAFLLGYSLVVRFGGSATRWVAFSPSGPLDEPALPVSLLRILFRSLASLWLGLFLQTTLLYGLTWLLVQTVQVYPLDLTALTLANLILIPGSLLTAGLLLRHQRLRLAAVPGEVALMPLRTVALFRFWPYFLFFLFLAGYGVWLFYSSFQARGQHLLAGATVFSDLGPHTALMASFSRGQNLPTDYPHFAGEGIRTHFLFYFLCGNLNALGLPFVHALNLPSLLAFLSFLMLTGLLAYRITGRRLTFVLTPLLTLLRSSGAAFTDLAKKLGSYGFSTRLLKALSQETRFIGDTPKDDWGLWSINVYANQRHLAAGLSVLLIVVIFALVDTERGVGALMGTSVQKIRGWLRQFANRDVWLYESSRHRNRHSLMALFLILLPYWHGSALIATLLLLAGLALIGASRLATILMAGASILSALLSSRFFSPTANLKENLAFHWGFLVEPANARTVFLYLLEMMGVLFPLILVLFFVVRWRSRLLIGVFSLPLLLAFTLQFTPDITVNHKFIQITILLWSIFAAELLARLFSAQKGKILARTLAIVLLFTLTATGLYEHRIYRNVNATVKLAAEPDSVVNRWILENTPTDAVFLTAPYSYHSFFFSGRRTWYGHGYYAWSAGHDTFRRDWEYGELLSARDPLFLEETIQENQLAYLLIDDSLRNNPDFELNEAYFKANYPLLCSFDDAEHTDIYSLEPGS